MFPAQLVVPGVLKLANATCNPKVRPAGHPKTQCIGLLLLENVFGSMSTLAREHIV